MLTALQEGHLLYNLLLSPFTLFFCPLQYSQSNHPFPLQDSHIIPTSTLNFAKLFCQNDHNNNVMTKPETKKKIIWGTVYLLLNWGAIQGFGENPG